MSLLYADLKTYFRQFPKNLAVAYSISRIIARIFDKNAAPTYSQFGEDRILPTFLPPKRTGFYVDVGANHPIKCSNTFWLYKIGWTGITIEPNRMLSALHKKTRPHDTQVLELVSDANTDLEFTEFENHLYSSASNEHVEKWKGANKIVSKRQMRSRSLTEILDGLHCSKSFELLCIDVEGFDLSVMRSLDWSKYLPMIVVAEMSDFTYGKTHPIVEYITTKGYFLMAFDGYNGLFLHKTSSAKNLGE